MTLRTAAVLATLALFPMAVLRVAVLLGPAPTGIDGGNWLAFGTFGRSGMDYPPLVPWLFSGLTGVIGPALGTTALAVVALFVPTVIVLGLALRSRQPLAGTIAALTIAGSAPLGEAIAWGGYPQVIAIGTGVGAIAGLAAFCDGGERRCLLWFGLLFALTVATSHLEAVPTLGAAVLVTAWYTLTSGRVMFARTAIIAIVAALPILILARTYLALMATIGTLPPTPADPTRILGPAWPLYVAALAIGPIGVVTTIFWQRGYRQPIRRANSLLIAAAAVTIALALAFVVSHEGRLIYDAAVLSPLSLVAVGTLVPKLAGGRRAALPVGLALISVAAVIAGMGLAAFPDQVAYYRVVTPDSLAAMQWLAHVPLLRDWEIAVADVRGVPLGWWAEGLTDHDVLFASDLRWLRFPSERTSARRANTLFYASGFPAEASAYQAEAEGVRFVLLPEASAFGVSAASPLPDWRVAFSSGNAVVLEPTGRKVGP